MSNPHINVVINVVTTLDEDTECWFESKIDPSQPRTYWRDDAIREIGYTDNTQAFSADAVNVILSVTPQAPEISTAVDIGKLEFEPRRPQRPRRDCFFAVFEVFGVQFCRLG